MYRLRAVLGLGGFALATWLLFRVAFLIVEPSSGAAATTLVIGSKADTEGIVLAEIMAQLIERKTRFHVIRRTQLGGTQICFQALLAGEIDVYPEYTGTALMALLDRPPEPDPARTYERVRRELAERHHLELLAPMRFNNTYALATAQGLAERLGLRTISDLKRRPELRAAFTAEFIGRRDGYVGLRTVYGLAFTRPPVSMEAGLMYQAAASGAVDVIAAYATDSRIDKLKLRVLEDDRRFFPPYQAAPLLGARAGGSARDELRAALGLLAGRLSDAEMRKLNAAVDVEGREPRAVARAYVDALLGPPRQL